jgi:hypothetical protein
MQSAPYILRRQHNLPLGTATAASTNAAARPTPKTTTATDWHMQFIALIYPILQRLVAALQKAYCQRIKVGFHPAASTAVALSRGS